MDPPPRPSTDRFRIRVAVFSPEEAHNLQAVPKHTFVIAKSQNFPLQDLPLRELRDVAIRRYKDIYPHESLFHIAQSTDSYGSDLFLNDRVGDIFADNEVLRVIKGASIRDSLPPDYVNGRAGSVQPSYPLQRKRSPATSNLGDDLRAGKRQKVYRPDDPLPSRERDSSDSEEENLSPEEIPNDKIIPNSQGNEVDIGHIKQEKPLPAIRPSAHQPSPVRGEGDDDQVVSDSQGKETSGQNITPQARQSQNVTKPQETIQPAAKTTPKPSNGVARRPSNKRRERSDDISDFEEHTSATPSVTPSRRGISDPYSDIETDSEQPSNILRLRGCVTPLRKSKKASPISARPKLLQYGKAGARSKAGSSSNNSTPKALTAPAPATTPRSARMSNGDAILPEQTRQNDSASADNGSDKSERGGVDAGAENAAREFTTPMSESARQKRIAELEKENSASISKAKIKADAAAKRKATAAQKLKVKQDAAKEKERAAEKAEAAEAKAELERENMLAEESRRQAEVTENAEAKKREEAKRQEAKEAEKREAEEAKKQKAEEARKRKAEDTKKQKAEAAAKAGALKREDAAKRENEASDRKEAEVASTHKRSTPARSPGGILGKAVADFNAEAASTSPGANVVDMPPPPAAARGRQSTSPTLTRKRSEDIRTTPILPPHVSSDTKPAAYVEPGSATRRVSFAEPSPPVAGKTPSRTTQSPAPIQTPKTVNGIQSSSGSFRQSKLVPPETGAKSATPKESTPSSSQAPTSGQRVKLTPTPHTRADITAALLNTINKGSSSAVKDAAASKPKTIAISSDEESSGDESVGELELPPLPPPSSYSIVQSQLATSGDKANDTASSTSRSASVSTNRSQRESRSPVRFVNSSFHSNAVSSTQSFDGSRRGQQNGSETSDKSTSGDSASEDEASGSELSSTRSKPSAALPSSQSTASHRILPPSSRLSQLREGSTTPKPQNGGLRKASSGSDAEASVQKLLDSQLTEESAASSAPARGQASPAPSSSRFSARLSSTPVPRPKLTNGDASDRGTPRTSERPAGMANMPSLKLQAEAAMGLQQRRLEDIRKMGEAQAKALKDAEIAELAGAESTEESEAESSSDDSDSDDESKSEAGSSNDVEMGGMGLPKAQKPKAKVNFSGLSKKFSKGRAARR
ncbi:hypothetical protein V496_02663 [Pseudogymnoascus sp. VKM F-4515 (FW-2607)]|nr:hypothetical protein V496_02663 [Pseudogymnoascus sp. VKM F-4515 (FW-2607)]KFY94005.1 hypothetical protein V498_04107 [Pseudogymnoascus sp. VKM F-4517 (FW-2822)]